MKPASIYKRFMDSYWSWYQDTEGIIPRINAVEGKAMKELIRYYRVLCPEEEDAVNLWKWTLSQWGLLESFYQKQKDLKQINSNINAIFRQLKKRHQGRVSDTYKEQLFRDLQS